MHPKSKFFMMALTVIILMSFGISNSSECDQLKIELEIVNTTNQQDNGEVHVNVAGGETPYHYVITKGKSGLKNKSAKDSFAKGLSSGEYTCIVVDDENCRKTVKFTVE